MQMNLQKKDSNLFKTKNICLKTNQKCSVKDVFHIVYFTDSCLFQAITLFAA